MGSTLGLVLLVLAAIAEATLVPQIRLLGGQPDLMFLMVLSWSIHARLEESVLWAFVGGITTDLLSAAPTGVSVVALLLLVFAIDRLRQQVFRVGLITLVGLVLVGTVFKHVLFIVLLTLSGLMDAPVQTLVHILPATLAYNLVLIGPIYWLVRRLQRRTRREERLYS